MRQIYSTYRSLGASVFLLGPLVPSQHVPFATSSREWSHAELHLASTTRRKSSHSQTVCSTMQLQTSTLYLHRQTLFSSASKSLISLAGTICLPGASQSPPARDTGCHRPPPRSQPAVPLGGPRLTFWIPGLWSGCGVLFSTTLRVAWFRNCGNRLRPWCSH